MVRTSRLSIHCYLQFNQVVSVPSLYFSRILLVCHQLLSRDPSSFFPTQYQLHPPQFPDDLGGSQWPSTISIESTFQAYGFDKPCY
jgi:hypothetical protein